MKVLKGVISDLVEKKDKKSAFDIFLSEPPFKNLEELDPSDLSKYQKKAIILFKDAIEQYKIILEKYNHIFENMADYEKNMIQLRNILFPVVKLTLVKQQRGHEEVQYIVARAPFYNPNIKKPEIRVYLGKSDELGSDLESLSKDAEFMKKAKDQIVHAMFLLMTSDDSEKIQKVKNIPK